MHFYFKIINAFKRIVCTQARSQDLEKGGGGFFERVRKVQTTLTRIFIVLESVSHEKLGNQTFFQPKNRWSSKKKKKRKKKGLHRN